MKTIGKCILKQLALLMLMAGVGVPAAASSGSSGKTDYIVEVQAMQDIRKVTDVFVTVKPNSPTVRPVDSMRQVQMKSFDTSGKLRWTKNEHDVAAQIQEGASTAKLTYSDMGRLQPVQAQVNLDAEKGSQILRTKAPVLFRPDFIVEEVRAPQVVQVNQVVNLAATIREMKGDMGGTVKVGLYATGKQLDNAEGVIVKRNGVTDVVFSARFIEPGTYTLTVAIDGTEPGDYDTSNNTKQVLVKVAGNETKAVSYTLEYYHWVGKMGNVWKAWYGEGEEIQSGEYHNLGKTLTSTQENAQLTFPINNAKVQINVDGANAVTKESGNIRSERTFTSGCNVKHTGRKELGDGFSIYVETEDACGSKKTYVSLSHSSADAVYYSKCHIAYWGSTTDAVVEKFGVPLRATSNVHTNFIVSGGNGVSIGGNAKIALKAHNADYNDVMEAEDYYVSSFGKYTWTTGNGSGVTQP